MPREETLTSITPRLPRYLDPHVFLDNGIIVQEIETYNLVDNLAARNWT